jgi:hypothetical protein
MVLGWPWPGPGGFAKGLVSEKRSSPKFGIPGLSPGSKTPGVGQTILPVADPGTLRRQNNTEVRTSCVLGQEMGG